MKRSLCLVFAAGVACAQPSLVDPALSVRTVIEGLSSPTSMAFIAPNEILVLEKETGIVKRVVDGQVQSTPAIDLAVNFGSERGLLGITLDPGFAENRFVYLYWTCRGTPATAPAVNSCDQAPGIGADSNVITEVPVLGNRVDRFVWNGTNLTFDRNLIMLRAYQNDGAADPPNQGDTTQGPAGNHNGGVIRFGPDGKLYIIIGDNGRRGLLQNLPNGPTVNFFDPPVADDQFGGPNPDNAHLTGVVIRLNPDGTTPTDNPFFSFGEMIGGPVGANLQKVFAFGIRNSFGMAFDPISGDLWTQENGDDTYDELNRVTAGFDSGWVQVMGPLERTNDFKTIEMTLGNGQIQQMRFPPTRLPDVPGQAESRFSILPGSHYEDPVFSWRFAVAPAAIGFIQGLNLGNQYEGDLVVGASRLFLENGYLFRFKLNGNRRAIQSFDARLQDSVADNNAKFDIAESETILFGRNFGVVTDIQSGPNGNLFLVSLSDGKIYEIFHP